MPDVQYCFELNTSDKQHSLKLVDVDYLGNGVYTSDILVNSDGFMCRRPFGFDNDEYFLTKLNEVLNSRDAEAILMDMSADSFLRFKSDQSDEILLTGYIVEHTEVTHSLEFAFRLTKTKIQEFADQFRAMVRANI